jgi:hypothetical protein
VCGSFMRMLVTWGGGEELATTSARAGLADGLRGKEKVSRLGEGDMAMASSGASVDGLAMGSYGLD